MNRIEENTALESDPELVRIREEIEEIKKRYKVTNDKGVIILTDLTNNRELSRTNTNSTEFAVRRKRLSDVSQRDSRSNQFSNQENKFFGVTFNARKKIIR